MSAISTDAEARELGLPIFRGRAGVAAFITIAVVVIAASAAFGFDLRFAREREASAAAAEEVQAFCAEIGLQAASSAFVRCVDGLDDLGRRRERQLQAGLAVL